MNRIFCYTGERKTNRVPYVPLIMKNGFTNLYGVYVDEDCRGQGIGTLLLAHLIPAYFKNHNLPLILNVRSTNTAAMQLYRHCGFEITSSVEFSYFTALPQ